MSTPVRDPNAPPYPWEVKDIPDHQHAPPSWETHVHNPVAPGDPPPASGYVPPDGWPPGSAWPPTGDAPDWWPPGVSWPPTWPPEIGQPPAIPRGAPRGPPVGWPVAAKWPPEVDKPADAPAPKKSTR